MIEGYKNYLGDPYFNGWLKTFQLINSFDHLRCLAMVWVRVAILQEGFFLNIYGLIYEQAILPKDQSCVSPWRITPFHSPRHTNKINELVHEELTITYYYLLYRP